MITKAQLGDLFTKSLRKIKFEEIRGKIGIAKVKSILDQGVFGEKVIQPSIIA